MSTDLPLYLGVDVGGTKILSLLVASDGQVLARAKRTTRSDGTPLAEQIAAVVDEALAAGAKTIKDVHGLGVAVPGVVDSQTGRFVTAPNLEIDDPLLVERLRERYAVPVSLGNDVNLGTLAEVWLGAGRGATTVVGIFVGTGIGGGVVIDGKVRTGPEDLAGEIGHLVLSVDGPECGCGNLGCFEALASRTAIERDLRAGLAQGRESMIADSAGGDRIRSGVLLQALKAGDGLVTEVLTRTGHYLGQGVLTIRHLLDPELIILGGGVVEACGDFLLPLIEKDVRADKLTGSRDALRLALSQLGDDAVALGAAALVRSEVDGLQVYSTGPSEAPDPPLPRYPEVERVEFGAAVVGGEEYDKDLYIRADGKVWKRNKKPVRSKYGTSHVVDDEELAKVCKGGPRTVIIAAGFQNMVRLTDEARTYLEASGAKWQLLPTPEAVEAYNAAAGLKALLLHLTC